MTSDRRTVPTDDIEVSYWMVSFLDMLGYGAALARMDVTLDDSVRAQLIAAVRTVVNKRRLMMGSIDNLLNRPGATNLAAVEGLALHEGISETAARAWMRPPVSREAGPDHVVLSCNLAAIGGRTSLYGPYIVFVATSAAMLIQLASSAGRPEFSLPLRGGMHVAPGLLWPDDQHLYSAARSRAYTLEAKCAKSPRTVMSEQLVQFLTSFATDTGTSLRSQLNAETAQRLLRFVIKLDEQYELDFYGPAMAEFCREGGMDHTIASHALQSACEGLEHAKTKLLDDDVVTKWQALVDYMLPRRQHWNGPA